MSGLKKRRGAAFPQSGADTKAAIFKTPTQTSRNNQPKFPVQLRFSTSRNKQETDGSRHSTAPPGAQNSLCGFVLRKVRRILLRLRQKISPIEAKERKLWSFEVFRVFRVRERAGRSGSSSETPPLNPPKRSNIEGQSISSLESRQAWTRPEPQSLDFAVS